MEPKDSGIFYESLFDNMPDGLAYCQMIFDAHENPIDWLYIRINENFEKLTGLKDAVGKKITELIPGIRKSNPELFEIYARVSLTGKPERFETYIEPLSIWFDVSVYRPREKFFVAIFQNITDRKRIEKDLENARVAAKNVLEDLSIEKSKEEAMLTSIGEGIIGVDADGRITFMNPAAQIMLGWHPENVLGEMLFDVVPLEDEAGNLIKSEERPMSLAFKSGMATTITPTTHLIYYAVRKDKTRFPVAAIVRSIIIAGKIIGAVEVFRDISKEKEIDRERNEFVSVVSHQLRTPLTGIQWVVERFTKKEELTPKGREYLNDIHMSAKRLTALVDLLLNMSRIESGKAGITPKPLEVIGFVESYLEECTPLCDEKKLELVFKDHPEELVAITDESAVRNIVQSIVSNAIEYSLRGGRVEIAITKKSDTFMVKISDTGIGIPEAEQARIFQKFVRAENAKLYKTDGTGIGLYLARWAARTLGGKIWFESEKDKGSTFYVELPLKSQVGGGEKSLAQP